MRKNRKTGKTRQGIALVIVLIFITIFSSLSVCMFSMSTNNIIAVNNVHQSTAARTCAESGLETIRYYAGKITLAGTTNESDLFDAFAASLQSDLYGIFNVAYDESSQLLTLGSSQNLISLSSTSAQGFYAEITPDGTDGVTIRVTGTSNAIERTIQIGYSYTQKHASVFDYGVATKGPILLQSLSLGGLNAANESNIYIESLETTAALDIQNAQIAGDVDIANAWASVTLSGGQSSIGGESGASAVENHVETDTPVAEFPVPNPTAFEQYVDGVTINSSTDNNFFKQNAVLENVRIAANTDPKFTGNVQIVGVLYIESPNVVDFGGNCDITGIIVAEGDYTDNSGDNVLSFRGNVSSQSVAALPADDARYDSLRKETGTFLLAPGFAVSFGGSFDTLNGCIVANGIVFFGSAGGEIGGSILNYSDEEMQLRGGDLLFNRLGIEDTPAGFIPDIEMQYNPATYDEIL